MAVVKANFVKRGAWERERSKASIRYIQCRRDKDGRTITRQLFGSDGPMERRDAYRMIDEAKEGSLFYRFVLSPDPVQEDRRRDLDFRDLTEQTMRALDARAGEPVLWVASIHADHAPHRHAHVIAILPKRLNTADLTQIREASTRTCSEQRLLLDAAQTREREQPYRWPLRERTSAVVKQHGRTGRRRYGLGGGRPLPPLRVFTCPRCRASHLHTARSPSHPCDFCGLELHQRQAQRLHLSREVVWQR